MTSTIEQSEARGDIPEQSSVVKPDAEEYETKYVHEVYQQIASHFSSTRYKVRLHCLARALELHVELLTGSYYSLAYSFSYKIDL